MKGDGKFGKGKDHDGDHNQNVDELVNSFKGIDKSERDQELEAEKPVPLEISIESFSGLGLLTLSFNRELVDQRRNL